MSGLALELRKVLEAEQESELDAVGGLVAIQRSDVLSGAGDGCLSVADQVGANGLQTSQLDEIRDRLFLPESLSLVVHEPGLLVLPTLREQPSQIPETLRQDLPGLTALDGTLQGASGGIGRPAQQAPGAAGIGPRHPARLPCRSSTRPSLAWSSLSLGWDFSSGSSTAPAWSYDSPAPFGSPF